MKKRFFVFALLALFISAGFVVAAVGTIDSTYKYAWSDKIGWINFAPQSGGNYIGATITDSAITGYGWNQNFGWINFSPTNGGVTNTATGTLSGYAFGENTGWINLSGVKINCSGQFTGTASGDIVGTINFDCQNCKVLTNWIPNSCGSHSECSQAQCVLVSGAGLNQCQSNSDCIIEKHNECNSKKQCILVDGSGPDQCNTDADCNVSHNECSQGQCILVVGIGISQCQQNADCVIKKYNKCNSQNQCVLVGGSGSNQCQTDADCSVVVGNPIGSSTEYVNNQIEDITKSIIEPIIQNIIEPITESVKQVTEKTKEVITSPTGSAVARTITTTVAVTTAAATITTAVVATGTIFFPSIFEIFLSSIRLWGIVLAGFGIKKRIKYWGVTYDSVTKQPLDPTQVILEDINGKEIASSITDIDGRYGFLVDSGTYKIKAKKTNYAFPSEKLAGSEQDEVYHNIYFGESIEIKKGEVITKNIPLDPVKFDWNEFAKKSKTFMKFYSKWDLILRKVTDWSYGVGFVIAILAFIFAPYPYNSIIFAVYLILLLLRILGLKPKSFGYIMDKKTGIPLSFAVIRIMMPNTSIEISHKIADIYGRYYCLVPKGKYYLKIEKKNDDSSYSLAYTSQVIDVSKKGIIKEKFKV